MPHEKGRWIWLGTSGDLTVVAGSTDSHSPTSIRARGYVKESQSDYVRDTATTMFDSLGKNTTIVTFSLRAIIDVPTIFTEGFITFVVEVHIYNCQSYVQQSSL